MRQATDTAREIAEALRAEWRMISSVSLCPNEAGDGYEATLRLDPIVVRGSLEQQGYPRTPDAVTKIEKRRLAALGQCVQRVNAHLRADEQIKTFSILG